MHNLNFTVPFALTPRELKGISFWLIWTFRHHELLEIKAARRSEANKKGQGLVDNEVSC